MDRCYTETDGTAPYWFGELVFQPAEERLGGKQAAIDAGLMGNPGIDRAPAASIHTISFCLQVGHAAASDFLSRHVLPIQPEVVTVVAIQGRTTCNIIPDSCPIKGAVRTLHTRARDIAEAAIKRLAGGLLVGMRIHCTVDYPRGVPCLANDDRIPESHPMR